ncbi:MarR family winged helix-turn-helix transcriptional regulator [Pseudoflavonifractor sp. MSJ-37]|uniref:MarR family winged helix-turn-helix transcriptional regulator n=1 Tax=Pseudoflavonifractor sp. MSJ-37 TaxID=2841531 RepID=UPI001C0FCA68|nr:MarR family transcriptional regulator [Pseudoflavonifractor sp. MSJ-37]MBU5436283.1 MarR family transcriptional regulator [Pseudoflavonifractor sp. MSJ-37]
MEETSNVLMTYLRVTQRMSQQFRSHFGRLNLTFPQALVLNVLAEEGPVPISTLAERTGSANSTVSGIVDRLEKLELAKRERSENDRRVIYVSVTDKYRALREKTATDVNGYFDSLLDKMDEKDRSMVKSALEKLETALDDGERARN